MRRREIDITAQTPATPQVVYALLADGTTWPQWSPIESFGLELRGDPPPEGVGAIRVFRMGRTRGRDQILDLVPNQTLRYATLSGVPVRDYVGEVRLEPDAAGGTAIRWRTSFFPKFRGTGAIVERGIRRFLTQCIEGLAAYAADMTDASSDSVER